MSNRKIRFGLWYDFRNLVQWRQPADRLYAEILDQIVWDENNGFDDVWLSEHHFTDDGMALLASTRQARPATAWYCRLARRTLWQVVPRRGHPLRLHPDG